MKIFIVDTSGCRPYELGFQMKNALAELNHSVSCFDYRQFKLNHFKITNAVLNKWLVFQAKRFKPDAVIVNKGESILNGTVNNIKETGASVVAWNPDEPFGYLDPFNKIKNIKEYDAYFTYDTQYVEPIKKINRNTYHLPPAADPLGVHKEHTALEDRAFQKDICLVGTAYKNRIDLMSKFDKYSLALAGPRWNNAPERLSSQALPRVNLLEMVKLFNDSKIVLNPYGESKKFICPNPRTFEIPATRSFQLTDMPREAKKYFTPKKEIVVYKDEKEMKELVDYYIENDDERNKIADAGYKRVLKEHTVKHRMKKMLDIIRRLD